MQEKGHLSRRIDLFWGVKRLRSHIVWIVWVPEVPPVNPYLGYRALLNPVFRSSTPENPIILQTVFGQPRQMQNRRKE